MATLKKKPLVSAQKKSSVSDNLYNNSTDLLINDDIKTAKEKLMLDYDRIPLNKIKGRDDNRFELVNIESLAKSIDTVRLAQPILLRRIDNSYSLQADGETEIVSNISYEIVSGHRRVAAYELLYERNKVLQNRDNIEKYSKIPMLIIDDLGKERPSEWTLEKLFTIVNNRYENNLPIIITTNYNKEKLRKRLLCNYNEEIVDSIISRLYEMCRGIIIFGKDKRKELV